MQQFDIARVFSRAWEEYIRGIGAYLSTMLLGLVVMLGLFAVGVAGTVVAFGGLFTDAAEVAASLSASPAVAIAGFVFMAVVAVLVIIAATLLTGIQNEITNQLFSGYTPNVTVAFQWARHRFHDYFNTTILAGIGVLVGLLLFVIPGLVFSVWWSLGAYLVTREGIAGSVALGRSKQLVGRAFWWVVLVLVAYNMIISIVTSIPILGLIVAIFLGPFTLPLFGALYDELRYLESGSLPPAPTTSTEQPAPEPAPISPAHSPVSPSTADVVVAAASAIVEAALPESTQDPSPASRRIRPKMAKSTKSTSRTKKTK